VQDFLAAEHQFKVLSVRKNPGASISTSSATNGTKSQHEKSHSFANVEDLLDFVTKQWRERWVMTEIADEGILDALLRRPFFILVSVDAPISLRWQRYRARYGLEKCMNSIPH